MDLQIPPCIQQTYRKHRWNKHLNCLVTNQSILGWVPMPSLMVLLPISKSTDLLAPVLWTRTGGWVRTPVLFLAICGPKYTRLVCLCGSVRSLQHRFPTDDTLLRSGDICDQVVKLCKIAPKFDVFGPPNFGRKGPLKLLTEFYKSGSPSNMWQSILSIQEMCHNFWRKSTSSPHFVEVWSTQSTTNDNRF